MEGWNRKGLTDSERKYWMCVCVCVCEVILAFPISEWWGRGSRRGGHLRCSRAEAWQLDKGTLKKHTHPRAYGHAQECVLIWKTLLQGGLSLCALNKEGDKARVDAKHPPPPPQRACQIIILRLTDRSDQEEKERQRRRAEKRERLVELQPVLLPPCSQPVQEMKK